MAVLSDNVIRLIFHLLSAGRNRIYIIMLLLQKWTLGIFEKIGLKSDVHFFNLGFLQKNYIACYVQ